MAVLNVIPEINDATLLRSQCILRICTALIGQGWSVLRVYHKRRQAYKARKVMLLLNVVDSQNNNVQAFPAGEDEEFLGEPISL